LAEKGTQQAGAQSRRSAWPGDDCCLRLVHFPWRDSVASITPPWQKSIRRVSPAATPGTVDTFKPELGQISAHVGSDGRSREPDTAWPAPGREPDLHLRHRQRAHVI